MKIVQVKRLFGPFKLKLCSFTEDKVNVNELQLHFKTYDDMINTYYQI